MKKAVMAMLAAMFALNSVGMAEVTDFSIADERLMVSGISDSENYVLAKISNDGGVVYYTQTHSDSKGEFAFDLDLSRELSEGKYNLEVLADDVEYAQDFSIPENKVYLESEKDEENDAVVSNTSVKISDGVRIINRAKISGKVENYTTNGNALLVITEKNNSDNIIYINESGLNEKGEFEFVFSQSTSLADCDVTVYYEDASGKTKVSESNLKYLYVSGNNTLEIKDGAATLTADITNNSLNEISYMLVIYTHDKDGVLSSVAVDEIKKMRADEVISLGNTLTATIPEDADTVYGVVWSSFVDVIPISDMAFENLGGAKE